MSDSLPPAQPRRLPAPPPPALPRLHTPVGREHALFLGVRPVSVLPIAMETAHHRLHGPVGGGPDRYIRLHLIALASLTTPQVPAVP